MTIALIGMTDKNRTLQEAYSTKIDESIGPDTPAVAVQNAHLPIAVARRPGSVSLTIIAIELTPSPARAAACNPLPATSRNRLGETALSSDPATDAPAEVIMIRLWPKRSARCPAWRSTAALTMPTIVSIQVVAAVSPFPRLDRIAGKRINVLVESKPAMKPQINVAQSKRLFTPLGFLKESSDHARTLEH